MNIQVENHELTCHHRYVYTYMPSQGTHDTSRNPDCNITLSRPAPNQLSTIDIDVGTRNTQY